MASLPFISGTETNKSFPLSRFLPPLPEGINSDWLANQFNGTNAKPWILDPFGANPHAVIEIARSGFRILVAANNPILRFYIELLAQPPSEVEFLTALAGLSSSYKGEERIEPLIRSLYITECEKCSYQIQAQAFLWDRGAVSPYGRIYNCTNCGDAGERPVTPSDIERAMQFPAGGLHRARALERIVGINDPDRQFAEEALDAYLPRTIFVLLTLINRLDSLHVHKRTLSALLLSVFDQATTLWPYPMQRSRPKLLTVPTHFRENNVWLALTDSIDQWTCRAVQTSIPISVWPELPPDSGGICLFEGRFKDLVETAQINQNNSISVVNTPDIGALVATIPRPNQAFWTLSALWTGWLWGKTAAATFKGVLRRRRYDWQWLFSALHSNFSMTSSIIQSRTPGFFLIGEAESGYLFSTCLSLLVSGFNIDSITLREEISQVQLHCQSPVSNNPNSTETPPNTNLINHELFQAAQNLIRKRKEPVSYLHILSSAFLEIKKHQDLFRASDTFTSDIYAQMLTNFNQVFSSDERFIRFNKSEYSLDVGRWWIDDIEWLDQNIESPKNDRLNLSDHVEMMVANFLIRYPGITFTDLDKKVCQSFTGLLTPERSLVMTCLISYGNQQASNSDQWEIRSEDIPENRNLELQRVNGLISQLGIRLGFSIEFRKHFISNELTRILWMNDLGEISYVFYIQASAALSRVKILNEYPANNTILVLPGSRSQLIEYKLDHNPYLRHVKEYGWRFLKFRHLYQLIMNSSLTSETFDSALIQDAVIKSDSQIPLL